MLKSIYFERPGDAESLERYRASFAKASDEELIEDYNRELRIGITGVRQQAIYLTALNEEMAKRFGKSPVESEGCVIGLSGKVELVDGKLRYIKPKS